MTIASVIVAGAHVGTLHAGYVCPACHEPLAILWARTRLGLSPCAATLDAVPVAHCPACSAEVDALAMFGPTPETT